MAPKTLEERQAELRERLAGGKPHEPPAGRATKEVTGEILELSGNASPVISKVGGTTRINREELYRLVWSEPMVKVSSRFGVSDVAVAKACRKHNIPLPGRGYWAQLAAGQRLPKSPLPRRHDVGTIVIRFTPPAPREEPPPVTSSIHVEVPATTRKLHPIAAETFSELSKLARALPRSRSHGDWGRTWARAGLLDIRVTPEQLNRAVRLMSALLSAAAEQHYVVKVGEGPRHRPGKEVQVVVDTIPLTTKVFEPVRRTTHVPTKAEQREIDQGHGYNVPRYDLHSTGKLQLTLSGPRGGKTYEDRRDLKLEEMLGAVVEAMQTIAKHEHEYRRQEAIEEKRRAEVARRRWEEEQRVKRLDKQLAAWAKARDVRQYLKAAEDAVIQSGGRVDSDSELGRWIAWMGRYADDLDPSGHDDIGREEDPPWYLTR